MKNLLKLTAFLCFTVIIYGCTVESLNETSAIESIAQDVATSNQVCNNDNPKSRLVNNGTIPFTFVVIDSNDNTAQILSIAPGTSSTHVTFNEGETLFAVESDMTGASDTKIVLDMANCTEVDITINAANAVETPIIQDVN